MAAPGSRKESLIPRDFSHPVKVVISVGGRFHAMKLAEQLYRAGMLERVITTKRWYVKRLFAPRYYATIPIPEYLGMLIRRFPSLVNRGYYSFVKDNLFDALARRYIPSCDVFHAWGNYALISMPFARSYGAKVVIERGSAHPHFQDDILREECDRFGIAVERAHPQIIEKGLKEIALADHVIIPSDFVRRSFLANGVPESKLSVIPYGIDLAGFHPEPRKDGRFRVLFVGNIGIQKGVHYLLEAWKQLALPGAELVFIGAVDPGMQPVLARYAGLFTLIGHVPHEELRSWYTNASAFILPSLQEGSALVTYEAMACGLPSIVSVNTGSIVRDGIDGFVIPIRDVEAIKEKILALYRDPERAAAMGAAACAYVQDFTWERYARGVIDVYHRLLSAGKEAA